MESDAPATAPSAKTLVRPLWLIVQFLVSFTLIAALIHFGKVDAALGKLQIAFWPILAPPILLVLLSFVFGAIRWGLLLRALGERIEAVRIAALTLLSNFCHQVILSGLGDIVRIGALVRTGVTLPKAATSVIFDRAMGVAALILLVCFGVVLAWARLGELSSALGLALSIVIPLVVLGCLLFFDKLIASRILPFFARREKQRVWGLVADALRLGETLSRSSREIFSSRYGVMALALSLAAQLTFCVALWRLAAGVGAPISFIDALLVLPPSLLISAIPISIGGWGVREGALTAGLIAIGLNYSAAVELSLAFGVVLVAGNFLGVVGWPWLIVLDFIGARAGEAKSPPAALT